MLMIGRVINEITNSMQKELDSISSWCNGSSAIVYPTKAAVAWFSMNNHIVQLLPMPGFNDNTLEIIVNDCCNTDTRNSTLNCFSQIKVISKMT